MGPDSRIRRAAPELLGFGLPFGLVLYLAMRGGGYDVLIRDEVGVAIWVVVMACALLGVSLLGRLERSAWIALGLLAALTLWIGLASLWSESAERSVEELGRVGTYLGVFVLALAIQGRRALGPTLLGVAAAIGVVGALAALSRMHPDWFPANEAAAAGGPDALRLNYPLNYWNGLGTFLAMGVPLLLVGALEARHASARVLATAAVPFAALAIFLTLSRGAWLTAALGLCVLLVVYPRRAKALPVLVIAGGGAAALILAAMLMDDLKNGLDTPLARDQGDELLLISIAVSAIVILLRLWLDRAERKGFELRLPAVSRRAVLGATAIVAVIAVIAFASTGVISDAWDQFKQPSGAPTGTERLTSASGNGRFEYWGAAIDAGASAPIGGIGPGAWDLWWSREATIFGFTRDAHSLYLETFAEIGAIGLLLLVGLVFTVIAAGVARARRADDDERALLAGALGSAVAFALAMGLDWGWEIAAIPVAFLFVAAALLGPKGSADSEATDAAPEGDSAPSRIGIAVVGVAMLVVIVTAMQGVRAINESKELVDAGDLEAALEEIDDAEALQPYALGPVMQRALVLHAQGELDAAAAAAVEATEMEPTNWRPFFTLAKIEFQRGDLPAAEAAYASTISLNPLSVQAQAANPSP